MEAATLPDNKTHSGTKTLNSKSCCKKTPDTGEREGAHSGALPKELDAPTGKNTVSNHADDNRMFSALASEIKNGGFELELGIEGLHCASCIRLIEKTLGVNTEVDAVRVNMSTERLRFSWLGERSQGDALAQQVVQLGYKLYDFGAAAEATSTSDAEKALLKAIAVAGFAAANLMLLSVGLWTSTVEAMGAATRELFHWISALIALPAIAYSGRVFFRSAFSVLKSGHTNMDVPISLAVVLACAMSVSETMRGGPHAYFDSAVMLVFFLLIGRYLDARAKGKARQSASNLLGKLAGSATVRQEGGLQLLPVKEVKAGMVVLVAAGENIAADGVITSGESEIDMSLISGETIPAYACEGTQVFAGTTNVSAPIEVTVQKTSNRSLLSDIVRMMEIAEQGAAKYVRLADRAASLYTPVVHAFGALTFLGWWVLMQAPWQVSLLHAVTVLIITCPCALGLAVPIVQVLASGELLKNGVLVKSGDALERLAEVDTVVFDKTGTLTLGEITLAGGDFTPQQLTVAASMSAHSKHPLSKALTVAYADDLIDLSVEEHAGKGLLAAFEGRQLRLGSRIWCGVAADDVAAELELWLDGSDGHTAQFIFTDKVRADAAQTVQQLQQMGLKTIMLSGDRQATAERIGRSLDIMDVVAGVSPQQKCEYLQDLKKKGHSVLMVGDGLNDAPALAAAHASMSPSAAIDITQNAADIIFQGERLAPVLQTLETARRSTKLVRQNFGLAIAYNIVAVPLAVAGFVTPFIAAAAMSGSSLMVILNAFRLKRNRSR